MNIYVFLGIGKTRVQKSVNKFGVGCNNCNSQMHAAPVYNVLEQMGTG